MTIAFVASGTNVTGSTSVTPTGATMSNGDAVLIHVVTKPDTATINTPAGWTKLADIGGGGGTNGNGTGPTRQAWFFREKDAAWGGAMPAISVTSGNITIAKAYSFSKDAGASWSTASATGTFGTAGATASGTSTLTSNPGITAGDMLVAGYSTQTNNSPSSSQGVTATGATIAAAAGAFDVGSTTGNDVGMTTFRAAVTAGTATAAPVVAANFSSATRGTASLVRLREVVTSGTTIVGGRASETDSARAGVAGHLTTNLETNPSLETAEQWIAAGGSDNPPRDNTKAWVGSWSVKATRGAGTGAGIAQRQQFNLLLPGAGTYRETIRLWIPSSITGAAGIRISGTGTTLQNVYTPVRDAWAEVSIVFNWDGVGTCFFQVVDEALTPGATIWLDGSILTAGSGYVGYFDGDTTDTAENVYSWTGTPHASASTRVATVAPATLAGGRASETDVARAGTVSSIFTIAGGRATETDEARAGTVSVTTVIVGGRAEETDEAFAGTVTDEHILHGGRAVEIDTARAGTITYGYAATDTRNRAGGRLRSGYGVATWDPPVAEAPSSLAFGDAEDVAQAFGPVTMNGTEPEYDVTTESRKRHRTRILVGGKDVTYFRDVAMPLLSYQLVSPLLYGPATMQLPQVAAAFERPGVGDLWWLDVEKTVKVQRVDADTGEVVATDYKGVIIAFDASGADLTVEIGGEASGRASLQEKPLPIFRATHDIGQLAFYAIRRELELPFEPRGGPNTGIKIGRFGGTGMLDYVAQLCARGWTRSGAQWTIMPVNVNGVDKYRMFRKDTTTVHGTAYLDDARTVGDLRRDLAEEPNRIFITGVTPSGRRVVFAAWPGLKQGPAAPYPFHNDRTFGAGTTNEDTDTGDGIVVMLGRLQITNYLNTDDAPGGYDSDVTAAIRDLQRDVELPVTGNMNLATWRALYDLDATGYSLRGSMILPADQKSYTKKWIRTGSGAQIRLNPNYDRKRLKRDRTIDVGAGLTVPQMREVAKAEIDASNDDNYVGTITFHTGALVDGDHTPGDPIVSVRRARSLKPGMNIKAVWQGREVLFHIAGVKVGEGSVVATVDTRARDYMNVAQIIQRNRESRRNLARQWERQHRASGEIKDALDGWYSVGGRLYDNVPVPGGKWVVFPVVAGQEGTVQLLDIDTAPNAEFVVAVFGKKIAPGHLARRIGNPLDVTGRVSSIDVTDGGEGYTSSPDVIIDGGGGSGATAHAVISGGKVVRVNVLNNGGGYTSVPSVSFDGGGGSGAYATANRSGTGSERWSDPQAAKDLDDRMLLYVAGSAEEPCGYYPRKKAGDHPLTGKWKHAAGFSYRTFADPVIYVAIYADRDTVIPAGRIMWEQLEAGA